MRNQTLVLDSPVVHHHTYINQCHHNMSNFVIFITIIIRGVHRDCRNMNDVKDHVRLTSCLRPEEHQIG